MTNKKNDIASEFDTLLNIHIQDYWSVFDDAEIDKQKFYADASSAVMESVYRGLGEFEKADLERDRLKNLCKKIAHLPEIWVVSMSMAGYIIAFLIKEEEEEGLSDYQKASYASTIAMATGTARGCVIGAASSVDIEQLKKQLFSVLSRAGAIARHAPTRDAKRTVFDHLDNNPPPPRGKDAAALAMSGTLVIEKFRTVRKWIDEWEKLRSAGTA